MGQKVKLKKFLSLLLVLAMILSMNMTVLADEPDGTASTVPASGANTGQTNGMITAFAALGQTQYEVALNDGVTQESIAGNLPQTLTATIDGAAVPITVTWSSANFQAAEGNYTFTANADGYELAGGVAWPSVNVTLTGTNPAEGDGNTSGADTEEDNGENVVAQIGSIKYKTLQGAVSALNANETLILLDDITNTDYDNVINIMLPEGAVLNGNGYTLKGNIKVTVNAEGGTVQNVKFKDIHNNQKTLSAVYASKLSGKLTITGCEFDNCDWDAIQCTPVAEADITITENTFRTDNTDGISQVRYVHIQSATNVDFSAEVTKNIMYDSIQGVNGAGLHCGALEIYYFTNPEKITANYNYIEYPELNCILMGAGENVGEMAYPMYEDENLETINSPVAAIKTTYEGTYYKTLQEALEAAKDGDTIQVLADIELTNAIYLTKSVTIDGQKTGMTDTKGEGCYKISAPIGANGRVFNLDGGDEDSPIGANATVTLKNIQIIGPMTADGNTRGVSVYQTEGLTLNLDNAYVSASCYALNLASDNTNLAVNITDSKLEGWCAFQTWSPATINISDSELIGTNKYISDPLYTFATIVVNQCSVASKITVTNSTIKALSEDSNKNLVEVLSIQNINNDGSQQYPQGNEIIFTDCEIIAEGTYTDWECEDSQWTNTGSDHPMQPLYYAAGANTLSINNVTYFVPEYGMAIVDVLSPVAEIVRDEKTITYGSLDAAVWDAQEGETITLLADVAAEPITIAEGQDFTLDLNNHTLTTNITLNGKLTVVDKSEQGGGVIVNESTNAGSPTVTVKAGGVLTLHSGTIKTVVTSKYAVRVNGDKSITTDGFVMDGGQVVTENRKTTYQGAALYIDANAHATISNGTITNTTNQSSSDYYAMWCAANSYAVISGGTFKGYVRFNSVAARYTITGGNYTVDFYEPDKSKLADGYILTYNEADGYYQVVQGTLDENNAFIKLTIGEDAAYYNTISDAYTALKDSDSTTGTIILLKDVTASPTIESSYNVILDLNGHTLTGHIDVEGNLTVKDSSVASAPALNEDNKVNYEAGTIKATSAYAVKVTGTLTVENGIISNSGDINGDDFGASAAVVAYMGGTIEMNNGYITGSQFGAKAYGDKSSVIINGGIVEGQDNPGVGTYGIDTGETFITVNGGTVIGHASSEGYIACGIYQCNANGSVNIKGGTIIGDGGAGVLVRTGKVEVTGGEINATGTASGKIGDGETSVVPSGVVLDLASTYPGFSDSYITIGLGSDGTGAKITAAENVPALSGTDDTSELAASHIAVSGGSFSSVVPIEYCANGYIPAAGFDSNNMYTVEQLKAKVYGATLTLDGTIGVNFYVDMSGVDETDMSNYKMQFIINNETKTVGFDSNACRVLGGITYYRFTCPVAAKQMTDTIDAQLFHEDTAVSRVYSYSVKQYCDAMIAKNSNSALTDLLKALLNYGGYAQTYFNYNTDNLANKDLFEENPIEAVTGNDLTEYSPVTDGTLTGESKIGATLFLDSSTKIRFYIYGDIADYTFSINGTEYSPVVNDPGNSAAPSAGYYIEVPDIGVQQLATPYTLAVSSNGEQVYSIKYSALTYAYDTLNDSGKGTEIQNVVKALYLYYDASTRYTGWMPN